jgi:hypothetical protein
MLQNEKAVLLVIGAVFFLIGLLGGGVEVSAVKIPHVSRYTRVAFSLVGAVLIGLAINLILRGDQASERPPVVVPSPDLQITETPIVLSTEIVPTSTPELAPTASTTPAVTGKAFFCDDFETIPGVWATGESSTDYALENQTIINGKYVWEISSVKPTFIEEMPDAPVVSDFSLSAELRLVSGPEDAAYGLVFRATPKGLYGWYIINSGIFMLGYWDRETDEWEYPVQWTDSSAIRSNSSNILTVVAEGANIQLFINEKPVASISDTHSSSGKTGISVSLLEAEQKATLEIDNYCLTKPPQ